MYALPRARHATFAACLLQRSEEALDEIVRQERRIAGDRDDMTDVCAALLRPGERGMQQARPSARESRSATAHGEATEVKLSGFTALTQDESGAAGSARNDTTTA